MLKLAAARANEELGRLPQDKAELIARAATEVMDGALDAEFPLVVFQTGSGTQSNMNANEVIANRADELAGTGRGAGAPIHPNDDVNMGQSSNDTFPAVMHIAAAVELEDVLVPAIEELRDTLAAKAEDVRRRRHGRPHAPAGRDAGDAGPGHLRLGGPARPGAGHRARHAARPARAGARRHGGRHRAQHATRASPRRPRRTSAELTGKPFHPAANFFAALSAHDAVVNASAALRTLAGALMKIANDVRWYASGPRDGIGELRIPENEPGSSIMPGKVNPTQAEALTQVAVRVFGNDAAVAFAGSQGNFQLNVYKPVMLHALLESAQLLAESARAFDAFCARGIEPDREVIRRHLDASLMLVTALTPHIGYEKAAKIAQTAHHEGLHAQGGGARPRLRHAPSSSTPGCGPRT